MVSNNPKRQHLVSRLYLSSSTDQTLEPPGKMIWVADLDKRVHHKSHIKDVSVASNFYTWTRGPSSSHTSKEAYSLVHAYADAEDQVASMIRRMGDGAIDRRIIKGTQTRANLSLFLAMQFLRGRRFRAIAAENWQLIQSLDQSPAGIVPLNLQQMSERYPALKGLNIPDAAAIAMDALRGIGNDPDVQQMNAVAILGALAIADHIFGMKWALMEAPAGSLFFTCDEPAAFAGDNRASNFDEALRVGWFPVSTGSALIFHRGQLAVEGIVTATKDQMHAAWHDLQVATTRYLYCLSENIAREVLRWPDIRARPSSDADQSH